MAASTRRFTLTSGAYQDVSEGAATCWFTLPFDRNKDNSVRVVLAAAQPSPTTTNYEDVSLRFPVGVTDFPQEVSVNFSNLASSDRVWVRAEAVNVEVGVHRQLLFNVPSIGETWLNLEEFYVYGATRGTETADTDAFQAALAAAREINGSTILVSALTVPRLIGEPLLITATRRTTEAATYPDMPVGPGDPDVRRRGSVRIQGPGGGFVGSINEVSAGALYGPAMLRYVGDGGGLFDIVSAYNVGISGLVLENASASAIFTTRVRSYNSPAESSCIVAFRDVIYSMTQPLALMDDGTRGAQHWQYDCKHVSHTDCVWLFGEDNSGNLIPCVRLGEDAGVNPTLIDGDSNLAYFQRCTMQGDVVHRRVQDVKFDSCELYPRRRISGTSTLGNGRHLFDGDKVLSGITLENDKVDGNDDGVIDEVYFDATGVNDLRRLTAKGHYRSWDKVFVLHGLGPFNIESTFNNPATGAVDITLLATATGKFIDNSDHSGTINAGEIAVVDQRIDDIWPFVGMEGLAADHVFAATGVYETVILETCAMEGGLYRITYQLSITAAATSAFRGQITINGVALNGTESWATIASGVNGTINYSRMFPFPADVNCEVRLQAQQATGALSTVQADDAVFGTFLQVERI